MVALRYVVVDVFTDTPFTGNQLAVVFGAQALSAQQLQAIAREFNFSETVFPLPPTTPGATYRARIFTPSRELPFAGHPSVGVAVALLRSGVIDAGVVVQECGAGLLPITVTGDGAVLTGGEPTVGAELDPAPLLAAVGLSGRDHVGPPPRAAGCGLPFGYLRVTPDAVARARPLTKPVTAPVSAEAPVPVSTSAVDLASVAGDASGTGVEIDHLSVFSWDEPSAAAHARVFAPGAGVAEDPATGSAALGLGVWLVAGGLLPGDGAASYVVHQGLEIHRPSRLDCTVTAAGGRAVGATVAGRVVDIASGEIVVPPVVG